MSNIIRWCRVAMPGLVAGLCLLFPHANAAAQQVVAPEGRDTIVVSLDDARRMALSQNPVFLADAQVREIARGSVRQARTYRFNPEIETELPSATRAGTGVYQARVSQELELAGQWGLRVDAAEEGFERAVASVENAARIAVADASIAFYAALADRRRLVVAEEILGLNEQLLDAVRVQVREGEISRLEGNLAQVEVGRAQARVLAARRAAVQTELELKRALGIAPESPIRLVDAQVLTTPTAASLQPDSLLAVAMLRRPDLFARAALVRQSETRTRLARREAVPNLRIAGLLERETATGEPRVGFGVALPLPLWNRNQGLVAERQAEATRARLELSAVELEVRTDVISAYRSYVTAAEEARIYETSVLEPARENQELLDTAFRAGKLALPSLLLLRNQLLDAELGYWDAWLALRSALVELQAATGTINDTMNDAR